jgi:PAS domain-containing protein
LTGSFSWRVETDEITWSEELYRIFEFDPHVPVTLELIGSRVHPEDIPLLNDMIDRARGAGSDFEYEHRLHMPNHSIKYLHLVGHGRRDGDGRLVYIGAAQDVTEFKKCSGRRRCRRPSTCTRKGTTTTKSVRRISSVD